MKDKIEQINHYLLIPVALVTLGSGIIAIIKETEWYVYILFFFLQLYVLRF